MANRQYAYFEELPLKCHFRLNGEPCIKTSTRTAFLVRAGRRFHFGKTDLCVVAPYSRLAHNYFAA